MKRLLFILVLACISCVQGAWYWPFESGEDDTNSPPRLHRLLEKANDFIELAEDEAAQGEADKALDFYRQALDELYHVQKENPERAETPEFAPLRNKIAACRAAVDAIRFDQVNANVRAVAVTDTTELQRKWNKKHGIKEEEDTFVLKGKEEKKEGASKAAATPEPIPWQDRLKVAVRRLKEGDTAGAEQVLEKMSAEKPTDLNLLLIKAAVLASDGRFYAARKELEAAAKAHPASPLPHYNMAYVALQVGEGRRVARKHYERGRELGGPVNKDLEARLQK